MWHQEGTVRREERFFFSSHLPPWHVISQAYLLQGSNQTLFFVSPLCSYASQNNPLGFASNVVNVKLHLRNDGSSTSTDVHIAYLYNYIQTNKAMINIDSTLVSRHRFQGNEMSPSDISLQDSTMSDLSEGVDSHQAALILAGTKPHLEFDLFLTFTCNQVNHSLTGL